MPSLLSGRLLRSAAIAIGATLLTATAAFASPPGWTPGSGDERATAHAGNVTTCAQAGLSGRTVTFDGVEDETGTYVTITKADIPAGETILSVVVKGGPAYNVYTGLKSWTNLHSPINVGGQTPTISHWFACVSGGEGGGSTTKCPPSGTTTTTTGESTTTTTAPTKETTTGTTGSTTTTTGTTGGSTVSTSSTTAAVAAASNGQTPTKTLAFTGFANSWLIWVGVLLLIVGALAVAMPRLARRRS